MYATAHLPALHVMAPLHTLGGTPASQSATVLQPVVPPPLPPVPLLLLLELDVELPFGHSRVLSQSPPKSKTQADTTWPATRSAPATPATQRTRVRGRTRIVLLLRSGPGPRPRRMKRRPPGRPTGPWPRREPS